MNSFLFCLLVGAVAGVLIGFAEANVARAAAGLLISPFVMAFALQRLNRPLKWWKRLSSYLLGCATQLAVCSALYTVLCSLEIIYTTCIALPWQNVIAANCLLAIFGALLMTLPVLLPQAPIDGA